jgi:pyruvate/2-oxoglutarate dehydrogenase complex dihydrolipoamide acyltransferase (E2) component
MKIQAGNYKIMQYPKLRRVQALSLHSAQRLPMIHLLIEVDVTKARQLLREHKTKTGESLSFTAFILHCLAQAVSENKMMQAYQKGQKQLVLFDDVDVAITIEREMEGNKQPIIYIIRAANQKSLQEIHQEIRTAQHQAVKDAWEGMKWFGFLPLVGFRIIWPFLWRIIRTYPQVQRKFAGTVGVSAVGMFGDGGGWGIPINAHTLDLTIGGIAEKPGIVDGQIAIREFLSMTLSVNHNIIDGVPAARATSRLKELIEDGFSLAEHELV